MKVQLFVGWYNSDNASRMAVWSSLDSQNMYWQNLISQNAGTEYEGDNYDGLGKPIVLSIPPYDMARYSYGRMNIDGTWFYFSVESFEYINSSLVKIYYILDCWETAQMQFFPLFGRAHIYRSGVKKPTRLKRPYAPNSVRTSWSGVVPQELSLIAYCHDSTENENYLLQVNTRYLTAEQMAIIFDGGWVNQAYVKANEILGAWLSPWPLALYNATQLIPANLPIYKTSDIYRSMTTKKITLPNTPRGTDDDAVSLTDLRGNAVWTSDYSENWSSEMEVYSDISPTSFCWHGHITPLSPTNEVVEGAFTIPGEPVDVWNDSWLEYASRERTYNIQMRQFANEKQLVQGLASVGGSGMSGAVAGAMGGAGGPIGAVAGLGIGTLQAGAGFVIDDHYGVKEQRATDQYFQMKRDELAFASSGVAGVMRHITDVKLNTATVDKGTRDRYKADIAVGGYYYDYDVANFKEWLQDGPITANVEIRGLPGEWCKQINARFNNGVVITNG